MADVVRAKGEHRVAVVIPARDEEQTIADVVTQIRLDLVDAASLVDELVVMDSLSSDHTAKVAADAGAVVHSVADVRPDLGVRAGKGEALWKSLFVTSADLLVFIDADLTDWGPHFVTGLVGPLLAADSTLLVKGFYDRQLDFGEGIAAEGGRVTELVARPWLALNRPELSTVVQPLAGEWAVRRSHIERLSIPVGYGVEIATLVDTADGAGVDAVAQVDLGQRGGIGTRTCTTSARWRTNSWLSIERRNGRETAAAGVMPAITRDRTWQLRAVDLTERPPVGADHRVLDSAAAGFLTGLSLIVAIGAQNAYVLRQGVLRMHVPAVVAVCAVSDLVLILAGVGAVRACHRRPCAGAARRRSLVRCRVPALVRPRGAAPRRENGGAVRGGCRIASRVSRQGGRAGCHPHVAQPTCLPRHGPAGRLHRRHSSTTSSVAMVVRRRRWAGQHRVVQRTGIRAAGSPRYWPGRGRGSSSNWVSRPR